MPILTFGVTSSGVLATATFLPSKTSRQLLSQAGRPAAAPVVLPVLIDSGATHSAIDAAEILHWHMPYRSAHSNTVGGKVAIKVYSLELRLSGRAGSGYWEVEPLAVEGNMVHSFHDTSYKGVIGRDVLDGGLFVYDGPNKYSTLSF
jgi:hypothetical protein